MQHPFLKDFPSVTLSDSIRNMYAGERGSLIIIVEGANEEINKMFHERKGRTKTDLKINLNDYAKPLTKYLFSKSSHLKSADINRRN